MDQYEKIETIGAGAFGKVVKVKRKNDGKILVWKELNYGAMNEQEKQQLVSEVNILRELRNPFIVRYYDRIVDKVNTRLYIVMEHCSGGDLGRVIKKCIKNRQNLDEGIIWKVFAQAIVALKDCHRRVENGEKRPILHRDLKPANIMLDNHENIKIGDFGLAKELSSGSRLAQTNVGTPFYMSPEIISGKRYGEKSDVWSLGCLLYELAALRPPFNASNQLQLARMIGAGKFHRIPKKYSDELNGAITSMLKVDPRDRPRVENLEEVAGIKSYLRSASSIMQEHQFQQTYSHKMRDLKALEESLQARSNALAKREDEVKSREASVRIREKKVESDERRLAVPTTEDITPVAAAAAAAGKHRNDYQYILPVAKSMCNGGERRMSVMSEGNGDDDDCNDLDDDTPPPVGNGNGNGNGFQIYSDPAGTQNLKPRTLTHATATATASKENVFQFSTAGKLPSKPIINNFRQPPPPPPPTKKFQYLKDEGKGRQKDDGGSATKKQRQMTNPLQSLCTNGGGVNGKIAFGMRRFESMQ